MEATNTLFSNRLNCIVLHRGVYGNSLFHFSGFIRFAWWTAKRA